MCLPYIKYVPFPNEGAHIVQFTNANMIGKINFFQLPEASVDRTPTRIITLRSRMPECVTQKSAVEFSNKLSG